MTVKRTSRWGVATLGAATATLTLGALASPATADTPEQVDRPDSFTSAFTVDATPDQVVPNPAGDPAGVEGAEGEFIFLINSEEEIVCWDITVTGLATDYQSAAKTSTHIHENPAGENGPPRLSFPNPDPVSDDPDEVRTSSGCSEGPFTTGLPVDGEEGTDTGEGFELAQIEEDLEAELFSADTHTTDAVSGAVRGQLEFDQELLDAANEAGEQAPGDDDADADDDEREVPVRGVDTGAGGTASGTPVAPIAALMLGGLGAVGVLAARRRAGA
ncbi:CHRD domain-containing protein [Aeromicrobium sp. CF4.19]|uniref:CHRD domain-containing protein n=1 Tax=Aeromicrobium sp. CF4.19 TaxID=3373082 RepID=UPI003EE4C951